MINGGIVLLFDGIGEIIDENVLSKDLEITSEYLKKLEEYSNFILNEMSIYDAEGIYHKIVYEWIKKYIYDYCMYFKWRHVMNVRAVVPYSMGLITAVACLGGISFEDGIRTIIISFYYVKGKTKEDMRLLMVVGYDKAELYKIIDEKCEKGSVMEAADIGPNYVLLSGLKKSIDLIKPLLIEGGALKLTDIYAPIAYHTDFAKENIEIFIEQISKVKVKDISVPICSMYSNAYIYKENDLRNELIINIFSKMNVTGCINEIKNNGNLVFFEIGANKSLYRVYRSIDEDIVILKYLK